MSKKNISSKNRIEFVYNNKDIVIIPTNHNERGLPISEIEDIVKIANKKRNICYLIETSKKDTKEQILKRRSGDFTTHKLIPTLKKEYGKLIKNICIKGWDIRQTYLTQRNQDLLYHNPGGLPLGYLFDNMIKPLKNIKPQNNLNNYPKIISNYLKNQYQDPMLYYNLPYDNGVFEWIFIQLRDNKNYGINKSWGHIKIIELLNNNKVSADVKKAIQDMITYLWNAWMKISDLYTMEIIFRKDMDSHYYIFVGEAHYNNLKSILQNLKIIK